MPAISYKKVSDILADVLKSVDECPPVVVKEKIWAWLDEMPEKLEDLVMDKLGYPEI